MQSNRQLRQGHHPARHPLPRSPAIAAATLAAITSIPALAQDAAETGWSGSVGVGATRSTGSTESSNVNASARVALDFERWEHVLTASILKASQTIVVEETDETGAPVRRTETRDSADRLALAYQPRYFFRERTYAFGILDYESDEPANIRSAFRQIVGVGHRLYENDSGSLSGEIGLGNESLDQVSGEDFSGAIAYLGVNFLTRLSDLMTFNADFRADAGSDNTFLELGLGLSVKLSDSLNAKLSHLERSNSDIESEDGLFDERRSGVTTFNLVLDL